MWTLKTAEKGIIEAFNLFIKNIVEKRQGEKIYIWGASVRGTLLGILLEQKKYFNFLYVDNDERKWGTNINGHQILSPVRLKGQMDDGYIVVPVEHYFDIAKQLLEWGLEKNVDFFLIKTEVYSDFCEEFFRDYNKKYLVIGESFLSTVLLDERPMESMQDCLYHAYGKVSMKILSIGCLGMEESFYFLSKLISQGNKPEHLWLFVNFETLTGYHHELPRTQHPYLMEMLQEKTLDCMPDLTEYIEKAKLRMQNYKFELSHSPQRTYSGEENITDIQREYSKAQFLHDISLEYEECKYLEKILQMSNDHNICMTMIIVPINYQRAEEFFGDEFRRSHKNNINVLADLAYQYGCGLWDMSKLLEERFFEAGVTLQDAIKSDGRRIILSHLKKMEEMEGEGRNA